MRRASISSRAQKSSVSKAMKARNRSGAPTTAPWFSSTAALQPCANTPAIFAPRSALPGSPYFAIPTSPQTCRMLGTSDVSGILRTRLKATSAEGWAWTMARRSGRFR